MKSFLHILFVLIPLGLLSQNNITVSKKDFLIGEATTIYYEINNFKIDSKIDFNAWRDVIKCTSPYKDSQAKELEILFFRDTIITENETQFIGAYTVTAWDTGTYILPQHEFWMDDEKFLFESETLRVFLPQTKEGDEIIESELPFQDYENDTFYYLKKYLPWIIGGILILIFAIWFFVKQNKKSKNKSKAKVVSKVTLLEKTLQEIDVLQSKKLVENNKIKAHYIESSFILRRYLGEQFDLNLLEKTSSETRLLLIEKGLPADLITSLQILFNHFDSVKFAKFNPESNESQQLLGELKSRILEINNWSEKDA